MLVIGNVLQMVLFALIKNFPEVLQAIMFHQGAFVVCRKGTQFTGNFTRFCPRVSGSVMDL